MQNVNVNLRVPFVKHYTIKTRSKIKNSSTHY